MNLFGGDINVSRAFNFDILVVQIHSFALCGGEPSVLDGNILVLISVNEVDWQTFQIVEVEPEVTHAEGVCETGDYSQTGELPRVVAGNAPCATATKRDARKKDKVLVYGVVPLYLLYYCKIYEAESL